MKIVILDIGTLGEGLNFNSVKALGEVVAYEVSTQEQIEERIADADVVIANKMELYEDNLKNAKKLKLICVTATGFDNIDIEYCAKRGIGVCNVVGYSTDSVVQLTIALAFSLTTNLLSFDSYVKSGEYTKSGIFNSVSPVFHEISGLTWGIVGLGNIGKKVAKIAQAMGCNILAYKRTPDPEYNCVDIETLCRKSDIITVHTPLNDGTYHLIDEEKLSMMKKGVILVNVARGAVFDEEAVCRAVENGKIGGLGIDVYSAEPMKEDSPYQRILEKDNVIFTPHMAWGAIESRQRCIDEVALNIESFAKGIKHSRIV